MRTVALLAEYGLQYPAPAEERMFGDPSQIASCPNTGKFYVVDTTRKGVYRLSPGSDDREHLFPELDVQSIAIGTGGDLYLIVDGELLRSDDLVDARPLRRRADRNSPYLTVSASQECAEVVALGDNGQAEVLDRDGKLVRTVGPRCKRGEAVFALHCDDEGVCIVYERQNCIRWFVSGSATATRQIGKEGARNVPKGLFAPKGIARLPKGYAIADSYNNRIVLVDRSDRVLWSHGASVRGGGAPDELWRPSAIAAGPSGIAVADSKNGRVVMLDGAGTFTRQWGNAAIEQAQLRLPRSLVPKGNGRAIVADTHNDHLAMIDLERGTLDTLDCLSFRPAWPRCARTIAGRLWVTEGREDRLRIDDEIWSEFPDALDPAKRHPLNDPHELSVGPQDSLLLTNTGADQILKIDKGLSARPILEEAGLADPHSCSRTGNNGLVVADTGNDRILVQNAERGLFQIDRSIRSNSAERKLKGVRHCSMWDEDRLLVTLTDINLVLMCDLSGREHWHFGPITTNPELLGKTYHYRGSFLHGPKWACRLGKDRIAISDTGNSRILILDVSGA